MNFPSVYIWLRHIVMQPETSILCLFGCIKFYLVRMLGNHEFILSVYMVA